MGVWSLECLIAGTIAASFCGRLSVGPPLRTFGVARASHYGKGIPAAADYLPMGRPSASIIVRMKDEARDVGAALELLQAQTVDVEIVVVDSGSRDDSIAIARPFADRLIEIPAASYTPGRALNLGAQAASGAIHGAFSAHCRPPDEGWLERSLAHYGDPTVAATNGTIADPAGRLLRGTFLQGPADTRAHPRWGFSNHASTWRAEVWARHHFDETITCEDRKWSWEVIEAGWLVAFDPTLWVEMSHRWRAGARAHYRRLRAEELALASFATLPPYPLSAAVREWWGQIPDDGHSALFHRLNYRRAAALAGRYAGSRESQR